VFNGSLNTSMICSPNSWQERYQASTQFRVGDYRIIYKVYKNENLMVIHRIGHRREVYKL
jgi:mRNA-degrading endonuclease RelE of RelBE toxin-antitoxin system